MAKRVQKPKRTYDKVREKSIELTAQEANQLRSEAIAKQKALQKKAEETDKELDELIQEIDTLLEPNAEIFMSHWVQAGGQ